MAKKNESESKREQPEHKPKLDREQYKILKSCSEKKDFTDWNLYREKHPNKEILLEGADLWEAHLEGAHIEEAHLEGADLRGAHLEGAHLEEVALQDADFSQAIVDGKTLIWDCKISRKTDFEGVGLGNIRIRSHERQLLEYNIRRMNWKEWCRGKSKNKLIVAMRILATSPVRLFWWVSNYGLSTWRLILTFCVLAIAFATAYFTCGAVDYYCLGIKDQPGIVEDLFVPIPTEQPVSEVYYGKMVYFRSVYFSIVTMTTLGFGDMHANSVHWGWRWWAGHSMLILQVILGYVLLGALVTRFAVLFTAGGPAGEFTERTVEEESP